MSGTPTGPRTTADCQAWAAVDGEKVQSGAEVRTSRADMMRSGSGVGEKGGSQ